MVLDNRELHLLNQEQKFYTMQGKKIGHALLLTIINAAVKSLEIEIAMYQKPVLALESIPWLAVTTSQKPPVYMVQPMFPYAVSRHFNDGLVNIGSQFKVI